MSDAARGQSAERSRKAGAGSRAGEWMALAVVVVAFLALGGYYAFSSPLFSRPDEPVHYAYALSLRAGQGLPVVDISHVGARNDKPVEMEAHQPPLYYAAVAALSSLVPEGRDVMPQMNPYFFTTPAEHRNLWLGTLVASPADAPVFFTGRVLSLLCGAATLVFVYLFLRLFLPGPVSLLGAALLAFIPQFVFISTSFSNDMASVVTAQIGLWQIGVAAKQGLTRRRGVVLGVLVALALMAKLGGLALLAPLGLLALWQAWRTRRAEPLLAAVLAGLVVLLLDGWWFWRNLQLYGNPLATNVLTILLGPAPKEFGLAEWQALLVWQAKSFFLDFGPAGFVLAEDAIYGAFAVLLALGLIGMVVLWRREPATRLLFVLAWGWFAVVLLSVLGVTATTHIVMGGGRLLLPGAAAVAATLAAGLATLGRGRAVLVAPVVLALAVLSVLAPARYPDPTYPAVALASEATPAYTSGARIGPDYATLLGYDLQASESKDGRQQLTVTYYWQATGTPDRDYSVFIHLLGQDGDKPAMRAQSDAYPGYGAYPTGRWRPGRIFVDRLDIALPPRGQPADGQLMSGLYDRVSGNRVTALDPAGQELPHSAAQLAVVRTLPSGERQVLVAGKPVLSLPGMPAMGKETGAAYGATLGLAGYTLDGPAKAGGEARVYLYWKSLAKTTDDLVISLQMTDAQGNLVAQSDGQPLSGTYGTSHWQPGESVVDSRSFALPKDLRPGEYALRVVVYKYPSLERLPAVQSGGQKDFATLGVLTVGQ